MAPDATADAPSLSTARIVIPQHVVYRSFPSETVVLNLQTGKYHGLNTTAGRMLEALERAPCLHDAAVALALEYQLPAEALESDMLALCATLLERGLIAIDDPAAG